MKTKVKRQRIAFAVVLTLVAVYLIYRFHILYKYAFQYVEEDQGIMWYATATFAHGLFPEPMFFGQSYGGMLESLLAVPLYWIGVPLNVALPLATFVIGLFPFALLFIGIMNKERQRGSLFYQLCLLIMISYLGFQYDILTSIPRTLMSGFSLAVLSGMMIIHHHKIVGKVLAGIFAVLSCYFTMTSVTIILVFVAYVVLYRKETVKEYVYNGIGIAIGLLGYWYAHMFYVLHPEYKLHIPGVYSFSLKTLKDNLRNISGVFADFSIHQKGIVVILLLVVMIVVCVLEKNWRMVLLTIATFTGTLLTLGLSNLSNYAEGSILYGQSRMLLYVPVLLAVLIYMMANENVLAKVSERVQFSSIGGCGAVIVMVACFAVVLMFKQNTFMNVVNEPFSVLYQDQLLNVKSVQDVKINAKEIYDYYKENQCDSVVVLNDRTFGYTMSALMYDEMTEFNAEYDRRTWIYLDAAQVKENQSVVIVYNNNGQYDYHVDQVKNMSLTKYLRDTYGFMRNPNKPNQW